MQHLKGQSAAGLKGLYKTLSAKWLPSHGSSSFRRLLSDPDSQSMLLAAAQLHRQ